MQKYRNAENLQIPILISLPSSSISYFYFHRHQHHCNYYCYYYYTKPNFFFFCPQWRALLTQGLQWKKMLIHTEMAQPVPKSVFTALIFWHLKCCCIYCEGILTFHGEDDTSAEWKAWDKQHLGCRRNKKQLIKENSNRALWVWKKKLKEHYKNETNRGFISTKFSFMYTVFSIYLVLKSPPRGARRHTQE